jgi:pyruvate dehydrogenase E1 component alpha subunit
MLLSLLATMWTIRAFEEKVSELYAMGQIAGLFHLGIGQEGTAVGVCGALREDDQIIASHRPHGHFLAKGADPGRLMAELTGRDTGYCRGKGGSMHLVAADKGCLTATGIVGGGLPLALGAALASRERGKSQVSVVFFGDGAANVGAFHESLNLASLWGLPVVFVCENNGYAEFTPMSAHTKVERLVEHAALYKIPNETIDGNDVLAVRTAASAAVERARAGGGPTFLECLTYRLRGHYEGDPSKYRELSEVAEWKAKDPIARFVKRLTTEFKISRKEIDEVEREARRRAEEAVQFTLASPWPDPSEVTTDVYA